MAACIYEQVYSLSLLCCDREINLLQKELEKKFTSSYARNPIDFDGKDVQVAD